MDIEKVYKQTPTPTEEPLLIQRKLAEFSVALANLDDEKKQACLMAEEKCPGECGDDFRLVFLRCEVFNVIRAVERFVKYWDARVKVFGPNQAFLPMTIDGAMKDNVEVIKMNYMQVGCKTDPEGRAIVLFDFQKEASGASNESLLRAVWYQVHVALSCESAQKRGIVVYVRCLKSLSDWRPSLSKQIALAGKGILPVRFAGMHFVHPPIFLRIIMPFVRSIVGKKLKNRFYTHSGSTNQVLESLSQFGLGSKDLLPRMFGGKLEFL